MTRILSEHGEEKKRKEKTPEKRLVLCGVVNSQHNLIRKNPWLSNTLTQRHKTASFPISDAERQNQRSGSQSVTNICTKPKSERMTINHLYEKCTRKGKDL